MCNYILFIYIMACKISLAVKKKCGQVKYVESYLKDEWMLGMANNNRWYLNAAKA